MANRNWASAGKIYSMHVSPVMTNTAITIGTTGAVASFIGTSTASVTRSSTGVYVIHLSDNYNALIQANGAVQSPVSGLSGVLAIEIQNAPQASVQSLSAPQLTIKTLDAAGALVDPASGSVINLMMILSNSSVKG